MFCRLTFPPFFRHALSLLLFVATGSSHAATYYVDSTLGNDKWSGRRSSANGTPGTDGPWQSFGRVAKTALAPGDSVLLKCGSVWNETLTLANSGSATNPISVGAYPSGCASKPLIRGAMAIPAHNWIRESGNIYKTSAEIDVISFGTFEFGLGNWTKWSPRNDASMTLSTNCPQQNNSCMAFTSGADKSLAVTNGFVLESTRPYTVQFNIRIPAGVSVEAVVRRNTPPWDPVGFVRNVIGTGGWQTVSATFTPAGNLASARLDFGVPAGQTIGLDDVRITATAFTMPAAVYSAGTLVNIAHHPNRGYNPLKPDSAFLAVADNADRVTLTNGTLGSSYLSTGADLTGTSAPAITAGTGIRVRTNAWTISDRKVTSVSGNRLYFDSPTTYPVEKDWGYILYGQRWMLDQPGEWHYDAATKMLSIWMPDGSAPGTRVSVAENSVGIEASLSSNLRIDGIAIQNVGTGIRMIRGNNIVVRNVDIFDTLGMGLEAPYSIDSSIENSQFVRTAGDAISAAHSGGSSAGFRAHGNVIFDNGIAGGRANVTGLPGPSRAAIEAGRNASVKDNRIYGANYIGIWALGGSHISGNYVQQACVILDDCSAIYTSGQNNNGLIENNIIVDILGGLPGKPDIYPSQAQGIYLDELSSGITVRGNTVVNASNGIQLHNAANNLIEGNTLYNSRRHHVWLQERTNRIDVDGDVFGNQVSGNRFFSTFVTDWSTSAVGQWTVLPKDNTHRFAAYDQNLYFTLLSPVMSFEHWPTAYSTYSLKEWREAKDTSGVPRNLDPHATEVSHASLGTTTFTITGANQVPNGNLISGTLGWMPWNKTPPFGQMALESCTPASRCLRYLAGASESLLSSPNFSVQANQWYRVSFDLKTFVDGQPVPVLVRRGGGGTNGYESLMGAAARVIGSTSWKRFTFTFKATKTIFANDPATQDLGARIDFTGLMPGQGISLTNLELVAFNPTSQAPLRTHILLNPTSNAIDKSCPDGNNAVACSEYLRFSDGQPVVWPHPLPPNGSEIVYSRDAGLVDGDRDGIPDFQDACKTTQPASSVNAAGCALGQS